MEHEIPEKDSRKVDLLLLKGMLDTQEVILSGMATSTSNLEKHVENMGSQLKEKNTEQDSRLNNYGGRIHDIEKLETDSRLKSQGRELKDLARWRITVNSFMDMFKTKGHVDTGMIDTHAQQMIHAAELAVRESIPFKTAAIKMLPWFFVVFALACVLATILTVQMLTGNKLIALPSIEQIERK